MGRHILANTDNGAMLTANCVDIERAAKPNASVKAMNERDRRHLLMHFLALSDSDRSLRFGSSFSDELITKYVQRLDLMRDAVFGVYDAARNLVAVGHLAFVPRDAFLALSGITNKACVAEFGVSVLAPSRGMGIGSRLFERAVTACRNADVDTLYMHCLASNQVIMHLAQKAGMTIRHNGSEVDAYLKLPPVNARASRPDSRPQ